jgi:hypothetical protein
MSAFRFAPLLGLILWAPRLIDVGGPVTAASDPAVADRSDVADGGCAYVGVGGHSLALVSALVADDGPACRGSVPGGDRVETASRRAPRWDRTRLPNRLSASAPPRCRDALGA